MRALLASLGRRSQLEQDPAWLALSATELGCSSAIVTLERGEEVVAAAPFLVRPWRWRARLGYTPVASFAVTLADLGGDALIAPDDFALQEELLVAIARAAFDYQMIYLEALPTASTLHRVVTQSERVREAFWSQKPPKTNAHWRIGMPSSFDDYGKKFGGKTRRKITAAVRNLEKQCKDGMRIHRVTKRDQVPWFLQQVTRVSAKSWQGTRLQQVVEASKKTEDAYGARADRGWLRSYVLTDGDVPVSFVIGAQDEATYYYERIGYDPAWHEHSPGKVLLYKVIEDMYAERTPKWFDFGTGDSEYKRVFGTEQYEEINMYLLRKSVYMAAARATHSSVGVVDQAVRRVLDRYQLRERVRHFLRGRTESAAAAPKRGGEAKPQASSDEESTST